MFVGVSEGDTDVVGVSEGDIDVVGVWVGVIVEVGEIDGVIVGVGEIDGVIVLVTVGVSVTPSRYVLPVISQSGQAAFWVLVTVRV